MSPWSRAAALAGVWAAVEIVLGSFLHNLRVPLRGQVMTALTAVLLAAAARRRAPRGLFWRAGLICAALKSISPSAVLVGPMLAIAMEGFAMEAGFALAGGASGAALGGALAMTWTGLHLLGRTVVVFGFDAARLYEAAWGRLDSPVGAKAALAAFVGLHALAGAAAGLAGWRPAGGERLPAAGSEMPSRAPAPARYGASATMLLLDAAALLVLMRLARSAPLSTAAVAAAAATAVWTFLYPSALRRLLRPELWLSLAAVAAAAAWALGGEAGPRMVVRAVALTAGFAALGQELAGPVAGILLGRLGLGGLTDAVREAFASLPRCVAALPRPEAFLRSPLRAAASVLDSLDGEAARLHVLVGEKAEGKTTLALAAAESMRRAGLRVGGIAAVGLWEGETRSGFDLVELETGRRAPLCRRDAPASWTEAIGPYRFSPEALARGRDALRAAAACDVVVVDEVGPLELAGGGWSEALDALTASARGPMLWTMRPTVAQAAAARWGAPARRWSCRDGAEAVARALGKSLD